MVYDCGGKKLQRGFDFGIFKMAAVTMETAKIQKTSKCFKFIETYNKCCSANVDLTFEFGISKMATVTMATAHLAIGEGCHPLLLAMANLVSFYYYGTLNGVGVTYCYSTFLFFLIIIFLLATNFVQVISRNPLDQC